MKGLSNKTRNKQLCSNIVFRLNFFSQGTGLTLRPKDSVSDCAWIFVFSRPRRVSLTMALVFFPIDVIFLDSKKIVVELKEDFRPWQLYVPKLPCSYVIELEKGLIDKSSTKLGDRMDFKD